MSFEQFFAWLLGTSVTIVSAGIVAYVKLVQRITKVETILSMFGEKAAQILHSPNDHLGIDHLLDKYLNREYEMSYAEWKDLLNQCESIVDDKSISKSERTLAAFLAAICDHKMNNPKKRRDVV